MIAEGNSIDIAEALIRTMGGGARTSVMFQPAAGVTGTDLWTVHIHENGVSGQGQGTTLRGAYQAITYRDHRRAA